MIKTHRFIALTALAAGALAAGAAAAQDKVAVEAAKPVDATALDKVDVGPVLSGGGSRHASCGSILPPPAPYCDHGAYCTADACFPPDAEISILECGICDDPVGSGHCIHGSWCDDQMCWAPDSIVSLIHCPPDRGYCIDGCFCTNMQCYAPDAPESVAMCGKHGFCDNGSFCDGNVCYSPDADISIALCQQPGCNFGVYCDGTTCYDEASEVSIAMCGEGSCTDGVFCADGASCYPAEACVSERRCSCALTGGGPYWIQEGDTVNVPITCGSGTWLGPVVVSGLPAGATFNPISNVISWTPGLAQAGQYTITVSRAGAVPEQATIVIGVADRWSASNNVPINPLTYTTEYGLPVIIFTDEPAMPPPNTDPSNTNTTVYYNGHPYTGSKVKYHGASSLNYPKHSYKLTFPSSDLFQEPNRGGGFTNKKKLLLVSTFDDNSYLRQRLAYELWGALDCHHLPVQSYSVVVYAPGSNGQLEYRGLYTVTDHIDDDYLDSHGEWPNGQNSGHLFKAVSHDANFGPYLAFSSTPKPSLDVGYEKPQGAPSTDFTPIASLVSDVINAPLATVTGEIDMIDYPDWWIFVTMLKGGDSPAKNSYHLLRTYPSQVPWRYIPWDFNHSFGQDWQTGRTSTGFDNYLTMNNLFVRFRGDASIKASMDARYLGFLSAGFSAAEMQAAVDLREAEIGPSALRDEVKWGGVTNPTSTTYRGYFTNRPGNDWTTHATEIAYLKQWIGGHWAIIPGSL